MLVDEAGHPFESYSQGAKVEEFVDEAEPIGLFHLRERLLGGLMGGSIDVEAAHLLVADHSFGVERST